VIFDLSKLRSRWQDRNIPLACPSKPNCPGQPDGWLARFAQTTERLRCAVCKKVAFAGHWRTEGLLRAGRLPRE
jgi:hypothetical protein